MSREPGEILADYIIENTLVSGPIFWMGPYTQRDLFRLARDVKEHYEQQRDTGSEEEVL